MNAICLVIDGWHAGYLGCYGNTWIQTPAIDRLAMQSFVFDQAFISSPQLDLKLPILGADISSALITDDPAIAQSLPTDCPTEVVQIPPAMARTADSNEETQFAALFSAAAEWLEAAREPFCLWLHAQGFHAAWDAPAALRQHYVEDEELEVPTFVEPPKLLLAERYDPDELLAIRWAYAAQADVLDRCLEAFLEWFDAQPASRQTLLTMIGVRGYPLGEHRRVGMADLPADQASLHEELIHLPLLIRLPDGAGAMDRSQALVQTADLMATLIDWFQLPAGSGHSLLPLAHGEHMGARDRVILHNAAERAVRTPAWHLIIPPAPAPRRLYVKPDDRWELNEVADRCHEVADLLAAACDSPHSPLPDVLARGLES